MTVPCCQASDVVILALGIDGSIEGESNDRTSIALPGVQVGAHSSPASHSLCPVTSLHFQDALAAAVAAAGKPIVLLVVNGGTVDISPELALPQARAKERSWRLFRDLAHSLPSHCTPAGPRHPRGGLPGLPRRQGAALARTERLQGTQRTHACRPSPFPSPDTPVQAIAMTLFGAPHGPIGASYVRARYLFASRASHHAPDLHADASRTRMPSPPPAVRMQGYSRESDDSDSTQPSSGLDVVVIASKAHDVLTWTEAARLASASASAAVVSDPTGMGARSAQSMATPSAVHAPPRTSASGLRSGSASMHSFVPRGGGGAGVACSALLLTPAACGTPALPAGSAKQGPLAALQFGSVSPAAGAAGVSLLAVPAKRLRLHSSAEGHSECWSAGNVLMMQGGAAPESATPATSGLKRLRATDSTSGVVDLTGCD